MRVRRMPILRFTLALFVAACSTVAGAGTGDPSERFLASLRPVPHFGRQENAAAVLREFKAEGLIPFKPQRIDYTDFYPLLKPVQIFGHDLVLLEEEYMTQFIGCCVSEGAGMVLRLNGATYRLEAFAQANQCRVEEFRDQVGYLKHRPVRFPLPAGAYVSVSCRARDEMR